MLPFSVMFHEVKQNSSFLNNIPGKFSEGQLGLLSNRDCITIMP